MRARPETINLAIEAAERQLKQYTEFQGDRPWCYAESCKEVAIESQENVIQTIKSKLER